MLLAVTISCTVEGINNDTALLGTDSSANVNKIFDISTDNTGNVKITPTADGATSYQVVYGEGNGLPATVAPGASTTHAYPEGKYTVKIIATSLSGAKTEQTFPLEVVYRVPENINVTTSWEMRVKATALYAKSFLVYYGDVANEVGTPMAIDQELPPHTYPATGGPFVLKVIAQSGGAATAQWSKTLFGLPIDFESGAVDYFFGTFGDVTFSKVANPYPTGLNTSATVAKYTKTVGAATWSGTYSPLNIPVNFAYGKKIKILAYNPDPANIGKKLNIEFEWAVDGAPGNNVAVLKVPFTTSGAWEEIVFDYGTISGIPAGAKFTQLVLRYNDSASGVGEVIYLDNIRLTN